MVDNLGEVIQFLDGYAWGISSDGKTICMGKEQEIRDMLQNPNKKSQSETVNQILELELLLTSRGEQNGNIRPSNATRIKRFGVRNQRGKASKVSKSGLRFSRASAKGTRVPIR